MEGRAGKPSPEYANAHAHTLMHRCIPSTCTHMHTHAYKLLLTHSRKHLQVLCGNILAMLIQKDLTCRDRQGCQSIFNRR